MKNRILSRYALSSCVAAAMLAGCGGSSPPLGAPGQLLNGTSARAVSPNRYRSLYSFQGDYNDGAQPLAGLVSLNGAFYGTTYDGGGYHNPGTIFQITKDGKERALFDFSYSGNNGNKPTSGLIALNGTLYGTAEGGGCCGVVYGITTSGQQSVIYDFQGKPDADNPSGGLAAVNGTLYGVTLRGGSGHPPLGQCRPRTYGCGAIFRVTTSGTERVLYSFNKAPRNGEFPVGSLVAVNGTLYGTTLNGGDLSACSGHGCGTVFSVTKSGRVRLLYSFKGPPYDAQSPNGLVALNNVLYGTGGGGTSGFGAVFSVTLSGNEAILHNFTGGSDGASPSAGLDIANNLLYGTTQKGGNDKNYCSSDGCGTVFEMSTSGTEQVLYRFRGYPDDGSGPNGYLTFVSGTLYGTTSAGGTYGDGTVFALKP